MHQMRKYLRLVEAKQVGILYHFTDLETAWVILADMKLQAKKGGGISAMGGMFVIDRFRDWVSLTRNYNLVATSNAGGSDQTWGNTRIAIDGDKLSARNRIEPYHDQDDQLTRHDNQAEERIRKEEVDLTGCVLQLDVLLPLFWQNATDWESWVSPPDVAEQERYTQMARDDLEKTFQWCKKQNISINGVNRYRPVR